MKLSNLPPGVTDRMIEEQAIGQCECADPNDPAHLGFDKCPHEASVKVGSGNDCLCFCKRCAGIYPESE